MSSSARKSLVDVLNGVDRDELARQFDEAQAAADFTPLPKGMYRCRITNGEFVLSKKEKAGYTLTFTVDNGGHKDRRVWHTAWLTEAAMPMTKRDLAKLGVTTIEMLTHPLPTGIVCDVKVALRVDDDGIERNRVVSFEVVAVLADPTADDDFASPAPSDTETGGEK